MKFRITSLVVLTLAIVTITGCGSDSNTQSTETAGNATDAMFVNGMIPHHESAVEMAQVGVKQADHAEIKELSENIIKSQNAEIAQMKALQGQLPEGQDMMMSDEDMSEMHMQVESLDGADTFDKAFIDAMIPHHQSAVVMANQVIAEGSNAEVKALARQMVKAQSAEIMEMQSWRNEWYGSPLPSDTGSSMGSMHNGH